MFVTFEIIGNLSNDVFKRHTSTGSDLFSFLDDGFAQIFSQIVSIRVKKLSKTNFISSRHIKKEKALVPVDVRRSKTPLLKLPVLGTHICLTPSCDFVIYKLFLKFQTEDV